MRASNAEEVGSHGAGDPWEVFTQLVIQIIEGRTPGGEKGFHAGPHCSLPNQAGGINRHVCDPNAAICARLESLLRQLRLMWGVGVGVTVEVLVAPECEHGAAFTTTLDTTTAPSPQLRLIEQWNFTIFDRNVPDTMLSGWSLVAAVRSFLHFSQLSAWLSVSGGSRPPNILYRLTVTSPVFCSKFEAESEEEHVFPVANVGQETAIKVVVRSLPRSSQAPVVACHEVHQKAEPLNSSFLPIASISSNASSVHSFSASNYQQDSSKDEGNNSSSSSSSSSSSNSKAEEDLRRSMMRARLGDTSRASRSESPDTQLGESLLDPPNSLSRIPRRFQSPSRSGSPSLETPEHIICRVRQPGPTPGRPPDVASFCQPLVIPTRQPLNAFAWTQTRYPTGQPQQGYPPQPPYTPHLHQHHHSVHSEIFRPHASVVPSEPLNLDRGHALGNPSPRGPFSSFHPPHHPHTLPPHLPQVFFGSGSPLLWPHQQNIPHRDKCSGPFAQCSHFPLVQQQQQQQQQAQQLQEYLRGNLPEGGSWDDGAEHSHQDRQHHQQHQQQFSMTCGDVSHLSAGISSSVHPFGESHFAMEFRSSSCLSRELQDGIPYHSVLVPAEEPPVSAGFLSSATSSGVGMERPAFHSEKSGNKIAVSPNVSPTRSREAQGTKRKGAYTKESPRTKRESPPHVYYSKEGKELEALRVEAKRERNAGMGEGEEEYGKRRNEESGEEDRNIGKKTSFSSSGKKTIVNDQLWPGCSQPGKHLCSSVEDLAEMSVREHADLMPNIKNLRKEKRPFCKMDGTSSCTSKVSFDLTPKETAEVLRLLRQNTPVPPLRISQHKGPPPNKSSTITVNRLGGCDGVQNSDCLKLLKKTEKTPELKRSEAGTESVEALPSGSKDEDEHLTGRMKTLRCHRHENLKKTDRGGTRLLPNTTEADVNAYPTSSNHSCDTNFKELSKCKCDRKLEPRIPTEAVADDDSTNDSDEDVLDGLSQSEIENMKAAEEQKMSSSSCVEARTITQKTNYFTASSQPAVGAKDMLRQTSQTLGKSPLTSVLTSIQNESSGESSDETREKARRALTFDTVSSATTDDDTHGRKDVSPCASPSRRERSPGHLEATPSKEEVREDFVKSVSLLKHHLMKKPFLAEGRGPPAEGMHGVRLSRKEGTDSEEEKRWLSPRRGVPSDTKGEEGSETESLVNGHNKRPFHLEQGFSMEEDKEVEDLCRAKGVPIPSTSEKVKFRRSLDSAATLVFHNKTGLPLTSSPAPLRKGTSFDFDSSLNCIAAIRSAFRTCDSDDEEVDVMSKDDSPFVQSHTRSTLSASAPATVTCSNLLGSFEECVLNGRLEPVSTVHGFAAEIAASGVFCPKHTTKPVTVFFYTLCDNDQISSPYMGHINLGKKGYHIPSQGTVQVTLFNPHGTVVKMFVVVYDLSDMPPNSKTFLRQRTLNMPVTGSDSHPDAHQWLRYLIHLRFASSKSGKIYLHTDIRMLILRKSDADAATLHKNSVPYELRSFTNGPTNPKFSPRK